MKIYINPTYFDALGRQICPTKDVSTLCCPACGVEAVRLDRTDYSPDVVTFSCVNGHNFALNFAETLASTIMLSINVLVYPTDIAIQLSGKWKYDPTKRFINDGGYKLASEAQIMKIRELGGVHPNAFHELYILINQYWGYHGFSGLSSNDAGFVIAWLTGKYGAFPPIENIGIL